MLNPDRNCLARKDAGLRNMSSPALIEVVTASKSIAGAARALGMLSGNLHKMLRLRGLRVIRQREVLVIEQQSWKDVELLKDIL